MGDSVEVELLYDVRNVSLTIFSFAPSIHCAVSYRRWKRGGGEEEERRRRRKRRKRKRRRDDVVTIKQNSSTYW